MVTDGCCWAPAPATGHCGPCRPGEELPPNGDELGVSGRGPSGISGACDITNGGGFCAGGETATDRDVVVVVLVLGMGVGVVVSLLLPKNFLKPPNQPLFLVVTSTSGAGVISISLL